MTPKQVAQIQDSWTKVIPIQTEAAALFYNRLFEVDPDLRALFKGDLIEQGRKLMTMITVVVNGLTRLEALIPAVRDLGHRHAGYRVKEEHYAIVGGVLLWTLEQGLGPQFTPELKQAWSEAYTLLAATMQQGAAAAAA